jgi:hypothetical protein
MSQLQITKKQRAASARRRGESEELLPLDPRDPDITRAKRLQRGSRKSSGSSAGGRYWDRTSDLLGVNEALSR